MQGLESNVLQTLNAHSYTVVGLAFAGGILSSLLPCTVGMLPVLIGYVGGYTEDSRFAVFRQIVMFMLGFALVLTALGIIASVLGEQMAGLVGRGWYYFLGALAVVMGLHLAGVFHVPLPQFVSRMPRTESGKFFTPLILGAAFGAASSPCGTPVLTVILGFISREANWVLGGSSLFAYALGQSVLLLVVGLFTGFLKHMAILRHVGSVVNKLSAVVFVLAGLLLIAQAAGWLDIFAFY